MNTDTENNKNSAKSAFGDRGTNVNAIGFGHPYADKIIEESEGILRKSATGNILLSAKAKGNVPVSVMKGTGESGFSPDSKIIYLQVSGKIKETNSKIILQYVKALREFDQHMLGYKVPDPAEDVMEYARVIHLKNMDSITFVCKFVKELTNSDYFTNFLDSLSQLGYKEVYEVIARDGSQEEIFKAYSGR